ncbi:alpha-1B adrenergic receptor-like [Asterias amurensis]|uniref:alpha-1B adrenergic receptor-like n=1 Tax=Asterias amurensis TaxID=7602 RepID=UPI003AB88111
MDDILFAFLTSVLIVFVPIVGSIGFVGNVLVCVTIIYTKKLHNVTNLMILNLAVADALVSASNAPFATISFQYLLLGNGSSHSNSSSQCTAEMLYHFNSSWIYYFIINCFCAHSVLSLTLANYERFIGITRPLQYTSYFTRRKITLLLLAVWIIPVIVYLPRSVLIIDHFKRDNCAIDELQKPAASSVAAMLLYILPIAASIWMYIRILINLKQGARNLEEQGIQGPAQELHQAHKKVTSTLAIVTTAFGILVLPGAICYSISSLLLEKSSRVELAIWGVLEFLALVNSAINPALYVFKYKQMRKEFISMVCRCHQQRQPNQVGPL